MVVVAAAGLSVVVAGGYAWRVWTAGSAQRNLRTAFEARNFGLAFTMAERLLMAHPNDRAIRVLAARSAFRLQKWPEAIAHFREAGDAISDEDIWSWSESHGRLSQWREALAVMTRLYERVADDANVLRQMAVYASQSEQSDAALKLAVRLLEFPTHAAVAHGLIGSIYQAQQRHQAAADHLGKALELDPTGKELPLHPSEIKTATGWNLNQAGEVTKAKRFLEEAAREAPDAPLPAWLLGKIYLALNDRDGAYAWWIESMRRNRYNPDAAMSLGSLAMEVGEFEAAIDWLQLAANQAPRHPEPQQGLGNAFIRLGQVAKGREHLALAEQFRKEKVAEFEEERVFKLAPDSPLGRIAASNHALRSGDASKARSILERAAREFDDPRIRDAIENLNTLTRPTP